jgi:hypothetical protein
VGDAVLESDGDVVADRVGEGDCVGELAGGGVLESDGEEEIDGVLEGDDVGDREGIGEGVAEGVGRNEGEGEGEGDGEGQPGPAPVVDVDPSMHQFITAMRCVALSGNAPAGCRTGEDVSNRPGDVVQSCVV